MAAQSSVGGDTAASGGSDGGPWRSYVARLECLGSGADTALEAALRELAPDVEPSAAARVSQRLPRWTSLQTTARQ